MKRIILSQCVPSQPITCGNLTISSHKRICTEKTPGFKLYIDSVSVSNMQVNESVANNEFHEWLVYHAFIFDDSMGVHQYRFMHPTLEVGEVEYPIDYTNCIKRVYFLSSEHERCDITFNYEEKYHIYQEISREEKNAVKNYLLDLDSAPLHHEGFLDTTYWKMVLCCSIIEYVSGNRETCTDTSSCTIKGCRFYKKRLPTHHRYSYRKHLEEYLRLSIPDLLVRSEYLSIILEAYNQIRNNAVHQCEMPSTSISNSSHSHGHREIYNLSRAFEQHQSNSVALNAFSTALREVTRNLLMHKIFKTGIFPKIRPIQTMKIVGSATCGKV